MTNFKERLEPKTQTMALLSAVPFIVISRLALDKMHKYVQGCNDEIGWLATAVRHGREIYIEDTYLFDQEVHATTTEITPEGLAEFAMELLNQPDGVEIWNNMKVWGHSHVNMAVSPSGQDDSQMATFKDSGHDWFIRIIANKQGELKIDLYDYTTGVIYLDLPWEEEISHDEQDIMVKIEELEAQIRQLRGAYKEAHVAGVEEEMKVKVRKKVYATQKSTQNRGTNNSTNTTKKNTGVQKGVSAISEDDKEGRLKARDYYKNDDEVREDFTTGEFWEIAQEINLNYVEQLLWQMGYYDIFTEKDIERIYRVAKKEYYKHGGR